MKSRSLKEKHRLLVEFDEFLNDQKNHGKSNYGKCFFERLDGQKCQGWISEIHQETFDFLESGPMAQEAPVRYHIAEINPHTLAYWDDEISTWAKFPGH